MGSWANEEISPQLAPLETKAGADPFPSGQARILPKGKERGEEKGDEGKKESEKGMDNMGRRPIRCMFETSLVLVNKV